MILPADYHMHTPLCRHAQGDAAQYKAAAKHAGLALICFTDHAPAPDGYDPENRMAFPEFSEYQNTIRSLQDGKKPEVLFGIEADYYPGCESFLSNWLPAQEFDYVLGSVHYIGDWGFDDPRQRELWNAVDITSAWRRYFASVERLADTGLFDAVGHLDLPKKFGHRPKDRDLEEMARPALDKIAQAGMGIEINTAGLRKPVGEIYPSKKLLAMALERQIPICFGSDAHQPEEVGYRFPEAIKWAMDVGFTNYFISRQRTKTFFPISVPSPTNHATPHP